jgi:hypothetical protein
MYRSYQFLGKVKETTTGKLLVSLPRNCALVNSMWLTAIWRVNNQIPLLDDIFIFLSLYGNNEH